MKYLEANLKGKCVLFIDYKNVGKFASVPAGFARENPMSKILGLYVFVTQIFFPFLL